MAIKSIEWLGFYEAEKIAVKSQWMKDEVTRIYKIPIEKITVISSDPIISVKDVLKLYSKVAEAPKHET